MKQEFSEQAFEWFYDTTGNSIEKKRIPGILNQLGNHLDTEEELVHAFICHLNYVPELTHLNLNGDQIGNRGAIALAQGLQHVPKLIRLDLKINSIGDEGVAALAQGLHHVPKLIDLDLDSNQIGDEGVAVLAQGLQHVPKLEYIHLGSNRIGDEGAAALAQGLQHVPNLTDLDLWNNRIGPEGAVSLAQGLHHVPKLIDLDLDWNRIDSRGLLYLSYSAPNKEQIFPEIDKKIHPAVLSYLLLMRSDFPYYDLLNAWKKTFGPERNKKIMWNLLIW